ncbi:SMC family ATPase [Anaerobacillus alkaliphilus]|uniref:Nuclease SbcCD subunit C n=1 Tax=Anaerobacillus alkaliphilus TaxID=1548597 RepID=A0A4Q0VWH0_9BACI|nr:SMC family ATPase [Anaerobacillus alkaliphilus]RXJ04067.1 SMC family ATPase [Anaerobacillus alkaliphilus]
MRPLKLTMQAFGPYATKQEVDFTKLGEKTMFVVSGPTGAGKTTIFDGISFAIYGKASGDDRSGADLRSQFTQDDTLTEVSLVFELRGKRYLIIRSPQQEKRKSRGEGTTTINSKAELYELKEDENQLLASNVREVDEKVDEIMKIDCHQFRQIMMIPQGEFRKLLVSESKDKEKILQKLFHTEHYKGIEDKLRESAAHLRKQVERSMLERKSYIDRIQSQGNEKLGELLQSEHVNIKDLLQELKMVIEEDQGSLTNFASTITSKEELRKLIETEIHHGNSLLEQMELKDQLLELKQKLEARQPDFQKIVEAIQLAEKAAILFQHEERSIEAARQVVTKEQELQNAQNLIESLTTLLKEKQGRLQEEEENASVREAYRQEIGRLQLLEKDILSFLTIEQDVKRLHASLETLKENKGKYESQLTKVEEQQESLGKEKEVINEAKLKKAEVAVQISSEERMLERVTLLLTNKKQLITLENQFSNTEDDRDELEETMTEKNAALESLLDSWNKGQAGLLAQHLGDDHPCPVCGATDHPNKATIHGDMPTEAQIKEARQVVKEVELEKQKIDSLYYEAKSKFETQMDQVIKLADEVSENLPQPLRSASLEELQEHYEDKCQQLNQELKQLEEKIGSALKVDEQIQLLVSQAQKVKELLTKCTDEHESLYTSYIEKRGEYKRLIDTLPEELRNENEYRHQVASQQQRLKKLETAYQEAQTAVAETTRKIASVEGSLSSLQKVVTELKERQKELQQTFQDKLQELGFSSIIDYSEGKLPEIEVKRLAEKVQSYREELRSVTDRYNDLVVRLTNIEKPDLETLNNKLQAVLGEISELQEQRNILYHKVQTNTNIYETIESINKQMASVEEEYKTVGELADIAAGKNTYRITFERFVLASFLDDIIKAANARLNRMTNGRYQLQRKTERSKGNAQSGLELLAFDQYTGGSRHVKTLSGGESFKASLSLALGLADIVQSYSGGVSMETMFIDEGFGTLDPESLENAIETLIDIQSTGRLVGVISHVPELKERIDARFEVASTQSGSVVKYYGDTVSM